VGYKAVFCDLADTTALKQLELANWLTEDVLLINNAGVLGTINRLSDLDENNLAAVLTVNTIAPGILMQRFSKICGETHQLTVVNISSGAAKRAIPSWAAYCASKAALEMLSDTFYLEEREKGRSTKVYAVAPGVVHTAMQAHIRNVDPAHFSMQPQFMEYHLNEALIEPEIVAEKLVKLLDKPYSGQVSYSLRDIL
jgi:benzil reductase ((S)-benzoin forming)